MSLYVNIFTLSMLGALTLPLCAQCCEFPVKLSGHTVLTSVGKGLKMACPLQFCDGASPKGTWFKLETEGLTPVNLSERVTTEWTVIHDNEGILFLNFHNVLSSDSGLYQCQSGSDRSYIIKLSVCEADVHHYTVCHTTAGGALNITCPVTVCDKALPTVSWFKCESDSLLPMNVSDRVTTEWTRTNSSHATSFLIFHEVLSSDSGRYLCRGGSANHTTKIHVIDPPAPYYGWSFLYRSVGLILFFIIIASVYVVLKKRKDVAELKDVKASTVRSTSTDPYYDPYTRLSEQNHIYENVLQCV
ncbi:uncharacterized protein LOC110153177 [Boleophthalmus pectinirostris]|uniref:uncharacterized protein LOC110153177 n=1 Tax=Boleophthalmus pectinirostris TaxID=150288 RepID=UPI00242FF832|nr:uncharacterized protein LOC110153177 [Boleophthalmus pectinirostris]